MNTLGGTGLWDEEDGFYYDQVRTDGDDDSAEAALDGGADSAACRRRFSSRRRSTGCPASASAWNGSSPTGSDLYQQISMMESASGDGDTQHRLLAIPTRGAAAARAEPTAG